jgi:hypothetical protein
VLVPVGEILAEVRAGNIVSSSGVAAVLLALDMPQRAERGPAPRSVDGLAAHRPETGTEGGPSMSTGTLAVRDRSSRGYGGNLPVDIVRLPSAPYRRGCSTRTSEEDRSHDHEDSPRE